MTAERLRAAWPPLALIAALLLLWEGLCAGLNVPAYFLPRPSVIAAAFVEAWPRVASGAATTLLTALGALALATAVSLPLAMAGALSRSFDAAFRPIAVTLQVTPVVALAPIVVIWSGLDHPGRAVVGLAAVVAFFPIYSGAAAGLRSADADLSRLFDLYGASRWRRLAYLSLPSAAPAIAQGLRVGAGLAVIGAVVAEFVAGSGQTQGLAWRILEASNRLRTAEMFASLAALAILGYGLNFIFGFLENSALKTWSGSRR